MYGNKNNKTYLESYQAIKYHMRGLSYIILLNSNKKHINQGRFAKETGYLIM